MSDFTPPTDAEKQAAARYTLMNLVRIVSILDVIGGLAITQGFFDLPWALGAVLAGIGLFTFFFVPPLLARRWKAHDREQS